MDDLLFDDMILNNYISYIFQSDTKAIIFYK